MEYVQERVATLHDLVDPIPEAPVDRATVVVPMTEREYASLATERVLTTLEAVDPDRMLVPLRASPDRIAPFLEWLESFDLPLELCWCNAPAVDSLLDEHGLGGEFGKGRDVWLALGLAAADSEYVVVHDADAKSYSGAHVPRLLAPLDAEFEFVKGYYARVENRRLYGRLFRLLYVPLVRALEDAHDAAIVEYLAAFRYALSGEFAMTADLARSVRAQRTWGLEVGLLGDAFDAVGFGGTAQVDLGFHEHDHRAVTGTSGLTDMSREVAEALFRALEDAGVESDYGTLPTRYREVARDLVDSYAADARFNGLRYDRTHELEQVAAYADAIRPPGPDERLPAWTDAPFGPAAVREASQSAVRDVAER
ncbi:MAG: glucosyl-3-phosphoglycerate synthase [Halobacteriales archaeon]|jgi:glucosyl-3-phosphoglycerate synthase